jgi:hypothetical protein
MMRDPVRSPTTKHCYEKSALEALLNQGGRPVCPFTGMEFTDDDRNLSVDVVMKERIRDFLRNNA